MSIKFKIALLFAVLVTIILSIVSTSVYFFSAEERDNVFNIRLKNRALSIANICAYLPDGDITILQKMDVATVASLYNKSVLIAGYRNLPPYMFSDKPGDSLNIAGDIINKTKEKNEYYFVYNGKKAVAIHHADNASDFIVAIAATDVDGQQYLLQLKQILSIAFIVAVTLSFFAGLLFAKRLILPMTKMMGEVNLITSNNLSQRIKISGSKDELSKLAQTFNNLLDRLQDSFSMQRRFISNASHELSTPLTSITSQIEVAIQKSRSTEEYETVLKSILEDSRELQELTHSLLDIAKTGTHGSISLEEVRLDEVLLKVMSEVHKQSPGFSVTLDFSGYPDNENLITVFGNFNLLYMAFKNIVENGCKYSDNNTAAIFVFFDKTAIRINVSSRGDVIAEADIQNIFQPFFRASSVQQKQGFGLGLTLTKRIIALHKGKIEVISNSGNGTVFTIFLSNILADK